MDDPNIFSDSWYNHGSPIPADPDMAVDAWYNQWNDAQATGVNDDLPNAQDQSSSEKEPVTEFVLSTSQRPSAGGAYPKWSFEVTSRDPISDQTETVERSDRKQLIAYLQEKAHTARSPSTRLSCYLRESGSGEADADVRFANDRWSFAARGTSQSQASRALMSRKKKTYTKDLRQEIGDGDYIVVGKEEPRGQCSRWVFELRDINGNNLCNSRLGSVNHLRNVLGSCSDATRPPTTSAMRIYLSQSVNKVAVFSKSNRTWTISTNGDHGLLRFRPRKTSTDVEENEVPLPVSNALQSTKAAGGMEMLKTWSFETTTSPSANGKETRVYTLQPSDDDPGGTCRGPDGLREMLCARAREAGVEDRYIDGGPPRDYGKAYGKLAREGPGQVSITTEGWRFAAERQDKLGRQGTWKVGPGMVDGRFFPFDDQPVIDGRRPQLRST